jgi:hypothetical protein
MIVLFWIIIAALLFLAIYKSMFREYPTLREFNEELEKRNKLAFAIQKLERQRQERLNKEKMGTATPNDNKYKSDSPAEIAYTRTLLQLRDAELDFELRMKSAIQQLEELRNDLLENSNATWSGEPIRKIVETLTKKK